VPKSTRKNYDLTALENARLEQGFTYGQVATLATLPYDTVRDILSPRRHKSSKRQFLYFRKPNNIHRIAFALQLKDKDYIISSTTEAK
jgi:hypothetical protein